MGLLQVGGLAPVFEKVLIANRGEISVRIIRALREMGVTSVAVYSDPDREALHTSLADEAYHVGPAPAAESYLNIDRLIEVAIKSGAEAVHPGYGFLAESAPFARAVEEAGLVWMTSSESHRGDGEQGGEPKDHGEGRCPHGAWHARLHRLRKAGCLFAEEHGFPVAVKASAGGGGKGFAVARDVSEAASAFERASREGEDYFGDGSVYVERYLSAPRHVEIQVVRDRHGNAVHLGERDCSIQRRHQKLIEKCLFPP